MNFTEIGTMIVICLVDYLSRFRFRDGIEPGNLNTESHVEQIGVNV